MSQVGNAVTSSSKRAYRKGNPLSEAERQKIASAKKRATHKELKVFIKPEIKEYLSNLCEEDGVTQAEVFGWPRRKVAGNWF